ncbi:MAG: hypothetical protein RR299_05005 [Citrobacter sp.]
MDNDAYFTGIDGVMIVQLIAMKIKVFSITVSYCQQGNVRKI